MHVLRGLGPQEGPIELLSYPLTPYTHPYFGQLFLAGILGMIGYPDSLHPTADISSITQNLHCSQDDNGYSSSIRYFSFI